MKWGGGSGQPPEACTHTGCPPLPTGVSPHRLSPWGWQRRGSFTRLFFVVAIFFSLFLIDFPPAKGPESGSSRGLEGRQALRHQPEPLLLLLLRSLRLLAASSPAPFRAPRCHTKPSPRPLCLPRNSLGCRAGPLPGTTIAAGTALSRLFLLPIRVPPFLASPIARFCVLSSFP